MQTYETPRPYHGNAGSTEVNAPEKKLYAVLMNINITIKISPCRLEAVTWYITYK